MIIPSKPHINNLFIPGSKPVVSDFEQQYVMLRLKERRLYTDEELFHLPLIAKSNPHFKEWRIRRRSAEALIARLEAKKRILNILEVGCGNGWLSHQLSRIPGSRVIGMDLNLTELTQAARVFNANSKLKFIYGDFRDGLVSDLQFDAVIFAASIQYFPALPEVLDTALKLIYSNGEVHIVDSPLYSKEGLRAAAERTRVYYQGLGFPMMAAHYFHHETGDLNGYEYRILRDPTSWKNKLINRNPFPWICVKGRKSLT